MFQWLRKCFATPVVFRNVRNATRSTWCNIKAGLSLPALVPCLQSHGEFCKSLNMYWHAASDSLQDGKGRPLLVWRVCIFRDFDRHTWFTRMTMYIYLGLFSPVAGRHKHTGLSPRSESVLLLSVYFSNKFSRKLFLCNRVKYTSVSREKSWCVSVCLRYVCWLTGWLHGLLWLMVMWLISIQFECFLLLFVSLEFYLP